MDLDPLLLGNHAVLRADFEEHRRRLASLSRSHSRSIGDAVSRLDWLEQRIAVIEAHLGITPPSPPPSPIEPTDDQLVAALEKLDAESPDPAPPQNDSSGLTE